MKNSTFSKPWSYLRDLVSTDAVKSRRRSTLWLMLFTLLLLPTSMVAQTDYDKSVTFTALAANPKGYDNEKFTNLFDGENSKWCCKFNGSAYVIFEASKAGVPVGYTITTGDDNETWGAGRNPLSWKLYGNNEGEEGAWTLIQEVKDDTKLQDKNCTSYDFTCEGSTSYKYFKWEISAIHSGNTLQVGEFKLKLQTCSHKNADGSSALGEAINTVETTCTEHGYTTKECSICHLIVKEYLNDELKKHTLTHHEAKDEVKEHWQCDVCHKYFSDANATQEVNYASLIYKGYAVFDEGTGTLTFKYGTSPERAYDLNVKKWEHPGWESQRKNIKKVVFDASFANARPTSCYCWFSGCNNLTEIKGIEYLNTENVTNMGFMFNSCKVLTSLNLSNFNTEKVTDMQGMFGECWDLTSLDLTSFNTEKVTNMNSMFFNCSDLTSLNLSNFNTEKVMYMSNMFYNCNKLTSLDLTSFNTAEVTNMNSMFRLCSALTSLNLSNFNTAKVTDMTNMFYGCNALTSLNLSNFNTAKVTDMTNMFYNCNKLTSLDLTSFNTAEVTDMSYMFKSCSALTSLNLSSFNTANVKDMTQMFYNCNELTSLDLSNFNTAEVEDMSYMFKSCYALTSLDITSFNTANVKDMTQMFYNCPALTTIYASDNFVMDKVTDSSAMFYGCTNLKGFIDKYDENKKDGTYANYKTGYFSKLVGKNGNDKIGATGETLTAENLALDDEKDFVAYEPFAVKAASYSRDMNAKTTWATLCLPFEVSLDGQNFRAFKLLSADETTNTVELEEITTSVAAGTPVIIKMNEGQTALNFSVADKEIAHKVVSAADGNYQLQGLYAKKVFVKGADDNCYIVKGNKLMNPSKLLENAKVNEVNCKAFRAYMVDNSSTPAGAKMFSIGFDETATAIDNLNTNADDKAIYYDLQGHRLNGPQKGINIVKRGNKTMKVIIK